jgi:hypothetical protein
VNPDLVVGEIGFLKRCAALSPDVSDEKHEALLAVEEPL